MGGNVSDGIWLLGVKSYWQDAGAGWRIEKESLHE